MEVIGKDEALKRVDVALAIDAEGVHVGASDMPIATARKLMGEDKIVGATAKTVPWAKEAYEQGADYLGVGAIYPTTTKVKTVLTSTDTLRDICNAVPIPANAIGGLNKDNIDVLSGIPIAGICAVSAIMKADDPRAAASELKARAKELGIPCVERSIMLGEVSRFFEKSIEGWQDVYLETFEKEMEKQENTLYDR